MLKILPISEASFAFVACKEEKPEETEKTKEAKKLNMFGIRQIGNLWYSKKNKYRTGFNTAKECAEHFNK